MSVHQDPMYVAIVASAFGSTVVGLYIGYHAYRGFRRHDSTPMRYLSIGLFTLTAVTYSAAFGGSVLLRAGVVPLSYQRPFTLAVRISQFVGLLLIAYSLHRRP